MTKKLLLSLTFAALLVMAFGVLTSGAWFTDTASTDDIQVTLGTLDPRVVADPISITNAAPGITGPEQKVQIFNDQASTLAVKYKVSAKFDAGNGGFYNNLWVQVTKPVWRNNQWERDTVYNGWLKDLDINPGNNAQAANLAVSGSHTYYFAYTPSRELGNDYKGASTKFHLVFDATQVENPGW